MIIEIHRSFDKAYAKRILGDTMLMAKVDERIKLFAEQPYHPILQNHKLTGRKSGLRAFSITGDIRVIYYEIDDGSVMLVDIGRHNQVY